MDMMTGLRRWCAMAVAFAFLGLHLVVSISSADPFDHDSNKNEVRAGISAGGWETVWGKTIEEGDWAAVAACTYFGCLGAYFDYYLTETKNRFQAQAPEVGMSLLENIIVNAIRSNGAVFSQGRLQVKGGVATYNRWKRVIYDEPRTKRVKWRSWPGGPWTYGTEPYTERVEKRVPLPNHHQPYVSFRIRFNASPSATRTCPRCNGRGHSSPGFNIKIPCATCRGTGSI